MTRASILPLIEREREGMKKKKKKKRVIRILERDASSWRGVQ